MKFVSALFIILLSFSGLAEPSEEQTTSVKPKIEQIEDSIDSKEPHSFVGLKASNLKLKRENDYLTEKLLMTRQFQSDLLSTIYWALGTVLGLFSIMFGLNWFSNLKVYQRDKEALQTEVKSLIIQKTSEISSENTKTNSLTKTENNELNNKLKDDLHTLIDELKNKLLLEIEELRGESQKAEKHLKSNIKEQIEQTKTLISKETKRLSRDINYLDFMNTYHLMVQENLSANMALTKALKCWALSVKLENMWLEKLLEFIVNKLKEGGKLTASEHVRISSLLAKLPSEYKALEEKVTEGISVSDIF
ncbi:MAG: hypothetical protein JKY74_06225 [Shewanella sp.]|nr:hypothetical protein [Shewanella sp.]